MSVHMVAPRCLIPTEFSIRPFQAVFVEMEKWLPVGFVPGSPRSRFTELRSLGGESPGGTGLQQGYGTQPKRLIFRDDRTAPAIVDADCSEINVLTDALVERNADRTLHTVRYEDMIAFAHKQVIVFDRDRPVRSEAVSASAKTSAA